jgi:hypothetical protein
MYDIGFSVVQIEQSLEPVGELSSEEKTKDF